MLSPSETDRRPLKVRDSRWSRHLAKFLADLGVTPNQISVASVVFASLGAASLLAGGWFLIAAAACIQGRLLCNLLDGMIAVEHGKASPLGPLYNEFPDRIADSILLVAAGYAVDMPMLGWLAALAAALTAYVRVFGASCGLAHDFGGPMAKQHRMAVLTLVSFASPFLPFGPNTLTAGLALIAGLSLVTCVTRTLRLCSRLTKDDTR